MDREKGFISLKLYITLCSIFCRKRVGGDTIYVFMFASSCINSRRIKSGGGNQDENKAKRQR